jgi:zinc protease
MKLRIGFIILVILIFGLLACKSTQGFVEQNRESISSYTLDNGIPLVIKKNPNNRVYSLLIGIKGNVMYTPPGKAGIEGVTLQVLAKGSRKYDYQTLQDILFQKSSSINAFYNSFDYTAFSLFTLDKYFDELFPIYMDCFLHPAFDREQFGFVLNDMRIALQQEMSDPYSRLVMKLHDRFFTGHPYREYFGGTEESLNNITLDDVKKYYADRLTPDRMYVVAVGDFDPQSLYDRLNAALGRLPRPAAPAAAPGVPAFASLKQSELYLEPFTESQGLAYVRADFPVPGRSHPDYPALVLASSMLNDLLFEIVRIQHGAAYGMWSYVFGFQRNYASIVIFKTTVPQDVKKYIDESLAHMVKGECMGAKVSASAAGKGGIGQAQNPELRRGEFVPIADAIDFYKSQFITAYYGTQETNYSIASQILSSLIYTGDPSDYLYFVDKINAVRPEDIVRVINKYFVDQPKMWMVLGSDDLLRKINRQDYVGVSAAMNVIQEHVVAARHKALYAEIN